MVGVAEDRIILRGKCRRIFINGVVDGFSNIVLRRKDQSFLFFVNFMCSVSDGTEFRTADSVGAAS